MGAELSREGYSSNGSRALIITTLVDKDIPDGHRDIFMIEADKHCWGNKHWGSPFEARGCTASGGISSLHCEACRGLRYATLADGALAGATAGLWILAGVAFKERGKRRMKTSITEESAEIVQKTTGHPAQYFRDTDGKLMYKNLKGRWVILRNPTHETLCKAWPDKN